MKSAKVFIAVLVIGIISGCAPGQKAGLSPTGTYLTVDFQKGQTLRYKFYSVRDIIVDWGQAATPGAAHNKVDTFLESLSLVISYTPLEVDPYGISTIQATCETARVKREGQLSRQPSQPDAAESFAGKTWTFTVDSTGRIEDRSKLYDVIREAGQKTFRPDRSKGTIKDPDMLYDFIASQWFLWDSISTIKNPVAGVRVGDQWKSLLFVPAPMLLFAARDVNYKLAEIRQDPNGQIAVIDSSYTLSYPCPSDWPVPYTDIFQMSGIFGFLRAYQTLDLRGNGQELYNIDAGRIERDSQKWTIHVSASLLLPGVHPEITIEQTLTTELLAPAGPSAGQTTAPVKK